MNLDSCNNIADLRRMAQRRLPAPLFHYIDGGADDEWTLRRNTDAFADYQLMPACLTDVSEIDLATRVLGCDLALPFLLSPTGMSRLFHHHKELGVARAAATFDTLYSLSTIATTNIEDVGTATTGAKMFQVYILKDRELTREFVQRSKQAGYNALCLTVDTPVAGNRERDKVTGMVMPPRLGWGSLFSFAMHPRWSLQFLLKPDFHMANVEHRVDAIGSGTISLIDYVNSQFDRTVTWDDAAWLAKEWGGPFALKGVLSPNDAKRARDIGVSALMLSNHGGRQLDCAPAPVDCIAPIRDAVGSDLEIIVDGGVRRGTHIIKALALGANACSIGRAYLFGLAAGGQPGVERALKLLKDEVERGLMLLGCRSVGNLSETHVRRIDAWRPRSNNDER